jgi:hypothetical protein
MSRSEFTANLEMVNSVSESEKMAKLRAQYKDQTGQLLDERKPLDLASDPKDAIAAPIADPNDPSTWQVL